MAITTRRRGLMSFYRSTILRRAVPGWSKSRYSASNIYFIQQGETAQRSGGSPVRTSGRRSWAVFFAVPARTECLGEGSRRKRGCMSGVQSALAENDKEPADSAR